MKKWYSTKNVPALYTAADLVNSDWDRLMERVFDWPNAFSGRGSRDFPEIDVYEEEEKVIVKAEVAGLDKKDIKIRIEDDSLILAGEKKEEEKRSEKGYKYLERRFGSFKRIIGLPKGIDAEKVTASCKDGLLTINIPKTKESLEKGRDIEIK